MIRKKYPANRPELKNCEIVSSIGRTELSLFLGRYFINLGRNE